MSDLKIPEDLRPKIPCQKCGHNFIIESILQERYGEYGFSKKPLGAALVWTESGWFNAASLESAGLLVAYICQKCGFTEIYTTSPEQIPIGKEHGTKIIITEKSDFQNL
jgi:predicted nucleic-acid-binding Zn-ribbon protein